MQFKVINCAKNNFFYWLSMYHLVYSKDSYFSGVDILAPFARVMISLLTL